MRALLSWRTWEGTSAEAAAISFHSWPAGATWARRRLSLPKSIPIGLDFPPTKLLRSPNISALLRHISDIRDPRLDVRYKSRGSQTGLTRDSARAIHAGRSLR